MFTTLPVWYQLCIVGTFGAVIGSFLGVVIMRMNTGASLNGRSRCMSCATTLRWYELIPVFSYVYLRGRCRSCSAWIPLFVLSIELCTALVFLSTYIEFGFTLFSVMAFVISALLIVISGYDLRHMIIPDVLTLLVTISALVWLVLQLGSNWSLYVPYLISGVAATSFYGLLWLVSKGRWLGFGDVKLAFALGCMLGLWGTFSFIILSFWIGAALSLVWLASLWSVAWLQERSAPYAVRKTAPTIKAAVPFAPFMVMAFWLVWWWDVSVIEITQFFGYGLF